MMISDYLVANAKKFPDGEAIVQIDMNNRRTSIVWSEFNSLSNQVANFLKSKNIKKGDKLGVLLQNSLIWLPIYFGILKSGAVAVLLNYNNSIDEIEYCVEYSECKGIFVSRFDKCYPNLVKKNILVFGVDMLDELNNLLRNCPIILESPPVSNRDVAAIYFSSGTTGRSKAVLISHNALTSAAQMELSHHKQCFDDRFLCISPLYHTGAKIHWLGSLLVGGPIILYCSSPSPKRIINIIAKEKITIAFLLVPHIQDILSAIELGDVVLENYDLSRWRLMHSGAQYIPESIINRWQVYFPLQSYDTNYGLTESTGPGCIHLGMDTAGKNGAIGKPDPNWEIDIVDEGKSVDKGNIGELILKGPGLMLGYYKNERSTKETMRDGWLYTGDMAYMDEDDYIYIVGRKKDVIISGGENIYPAQIETFFRKMPYIKDVAVVGFPNPRMGELVAAVIEFKENYSCTKRELITCCLELPLYQRPSKFIFKKIIRNSMGKIDKEEMKKRYL